jgi:uncharacterized protein YndB with AHSA1/START domain
MSTSQSSSMSQIQRSTVIQSPRSRVWQALTDVGQFCKWFCCAPVRAGSVFQPGVTVRLMSTSQGPCNQMEFEMEIVDVAPETLLSWRWHPGAPVPGQDLTGEPPTLVSFRLEDADGGTRVTVTESGFDSLFEHRRSSAFLDNDGGWKHQLVNLEQYLGDAH